MGGDDAGAVEPRVVLVEGDVEGPGGSLLTEEQRLHVAIVQVPTYMVRNRAGSRPKS